ncbi:MAG: glycoside hydrolase family 97 catalytic domain-containing protein [Pyrinomonadaceae bacterium]|nr:glycoside hydrolase family 97 catalytic domain-containing protein [Sphingobacteriaceae bacterium]
MTRLIFSFVCFNLLASTVFAQKNFTLSSPDKNIVLSFSLKKSGEASYSVKRRGAVVLETSKLGLIREDDKFAQFSLLSATPVSVVNDTYKLLTSKKYINTYKANKQIFHLKTISGKLLDIIFQVSNDGLAFRYYFPGTSSDIKKIREELTSFNFQSAAKGWLQPMSDAKTGWARVHPSYEEYYEQGIPVGTPSPIKAGWVYPALFQTGDNWVLITETFPDGDYCGTRLKAESPQGEYSIGFPQSPETFMGGALNPESKLPWYTPWRVITIGSLKTITESTLGTDLAKPALKMDASFVKTGQASWSWVLLKDNNTIFKVQKDFIDYAADMHWEYCLIDGEWDKRIGYEKTKELVEYAKTKNVGILLWYNSAGDWNDAYQTPKHKMLTHESRMEEFSLIQKMGVKGVKVDFFGGDGQSVLQYYHDILKDAAACKLMVNYHGSSLPRGLQRTYPNLVSMEAIKGMEFATFEQVNEDVQPTHCAMLPFTRNAFDPMDYTPMVLHQIPKLKRKTSNGFELALPILFLSGIQHLAETPQGMTHVPDYVKSMLKELPGNWDDVKFLDGFPGKFAVIARRAGSKWYIAGINGDKEEKNLMLDLSFLNGYTGSIITDGKEEFSFENQKVTTSAKTSVKMKAAGGFVMEFFKK